MILLGHPYIDAQALSAIEQHSGRRIDPSSLAVGIGYWAPPPTFPDPRNFVDVNWSTDERAMVLKYLRSAPRDKEWRWLGYSMCRFGCGISGVELGTGDQTDGIYIWPVGFAHYVEKHAVRPPEVFIQHIRCCVGGLP